MVKRVHVPAGARNWFSGNELFGWPESVQYTPAQIKQRRRKQRQQQAKTDALVVEAMLTYLVPEKPTVGISLL